MERPRAPPGTRALVCTIAIAACVLGVAAVPALAGDFPGMIELQPDEVHADPGETVEFDIRMNSDGTYTAEGIERVELAIAFDPAALEAIDVKRGPWIEQGNETEIVSDATIDNEAGRVTIEQARTPPAGGATGDDMLAHLELRVRDDAPASDAVVAIDDPEIQLTDGQYQAPFLYDGIVVIDGGGEVLDPLANGSDAGDNDPGVILADDADEPNSSDDEGSGSGTDDGEEDPIPGFQAVLAVLALAAVVALRRRT